DLKYYLITYNTISEGEATLTATIGNKSVSASVITYYPLTGIHADTNPLEVTVGDSESLILVQGLANGGSRTFTIDSNVTLVSNDTAIATVGTDGKVTGVAVGTTTIDVT